MDVCAFLLQWPCACALAFFSHKHFCWLFRFRCAIRFIRHIFQFLFFAVLLSWVEFFLYYSSSFHCDIIICVLWCLVAQILQANKKARGKGTGSCRGATNEVYISSHPMSKWKEKVSKFDEFETPTQKKVCCFLHSSFFRCAILTLSSISRPPSLFRTRIIFISNRNHCISIV